MSSRTTPTHGAARTRRRLAALDGLRRCFHQRLLEDPAPGWRVGFVAAPPDWDRAADRREDARQPDHMPALLEQAAVCLNRARCAAMPSGWWRGSTPRAGAACAGAGRGLRGVKSARRKDCSAGSRPASTPGAGAAPARPRLEHRARQPVPRPPSAGHEDAHQLRHRAGRGVLARLRGASAGDAAALRHATALGGVRPPRPAPSSSSSSPRPRSGGCARR